MVADTLTPTQTGTTGEGHGRPLQPVACAEVARIECSRPFRHIGLHRAYAAGRCVVWEDGGSIREERT